MAPTQTIAKTRDEPIGLSSFYVTIRVGKHWHTETYFATSIQELRNTFRRLIKDMRTVKIKPKR